MPRMKQRRRTAAEWSSENLALLDGEIGVETDTGKLKIGDGATAWTSLSYLVGSASTVDQLTDAGTVGKLVAKGATEAVIRTILQLQSASLLDSRQVYQPVNPKYYGALGTNTATTITSGDIAAHPEWIGTYTTADTWDFVGLQEAIYAAFASTSTPGNVVWNGFQQVRRNRELRVPGGRYVLNRTLLIRDLVGGSITGEGRFATWIYCNQDATPAIATNACSRSRISSFYCKGFDLNWDNGSGGANGNNALQSNTFFDMHFDGTTLTAGGYGLRIGQGGYMGSETLILNCFVANSYDGIQILNYNALQNTIFGGNIATCERYGVYMAAGSVDVLNVGFQNNVQKQYLNDGYDVYLENYAGERSSVKNCRSESLWLVGTTNAACIVEGNSVVNPVQEIAANTTYAANTILKRTSGGYTRYIRVATAGTTGATVAGVDDFIWYTYNYFQLITVGTAVFVQIYPLVIRLNGGVIQGNNINAGVLRLNAGFLGWNEYYRPESEAVYLPIPQHVQRPVRRIEPTVDATTAFTITQAVTDAIYRTTSGSAVTVTLSPLAFVGTRVSLIQGGAGQVSFVTTGTGSIVNADGHTKTKARYSRVTLVVESNSDASSAVWNLSGSTGT